MDVIRLLTQDTLVRINRATGMLEARLAQSWTTSPDGLTWTLQLRDDVKFSDGVPFTSADVTFTFRALYDSSVASPMADSLMVGGKPLTVRATAAHTVVIIFPHPYGPGLEILEGLPMLPQHKLGASLDAGTFQNAWGITTPPSELAGLGPFVVTEYIAGQRMLFGRNPHAWVHDADGRTLPYLDAIELRIVPEQNGEILQLETGDVDVTSDFVPAETISSLRRSEHVRVVTAGVETNPDSLWFNLSPSAPSARTRPWLQTLAFRQALSYAVDRQAVADTVYLGAAVPIFGPVTPGHGAWFSSATATTPFNVHKSQELLGSLGLADRNGDGMLDDGAGRPVRFSVLTHKGHAGRERTMALFREQLKRVGVAVDIVPTDPQTIFGRYMKRDFDTIYFYFITGPDPSMLLDFWQSSGPFHVWNPEQSTPATAWEARIDDRMRQISTTLDIAGRRRLFAEVQAIFAEQLPMLYFVASNAHVAMSARVQGAEPSVFAPPVLWNAEQLWVLPRPAAHR